MEIEAKFSIPDEQTYQRLLEATSLAGFCLGELVVDEFHDSYLDTASGAFQAAGFAYRLRQKNGNYLATIKGLGEVSGAIHRRVEYELDLPGPLPAQGWPAGETRDLALRLGGTEPLVPVLGVEQVRHHRLLLDGDRQVLELSLDRGHLHDKDTALSSFLELEAELLPGGKEEDLAKLCAELENEWGLKPQNLSKFERGMRAVTQDTTQQVDPVDLPKTPDIQSDDPMSEAGRKTFRLHYQRMVYHEPGTRLGEDIEALHDMRVATRRMRAAFRVFGEYYQPQAIAPHLKGLKRTGRALGRVRDLDVFRKKIQVYMDTLPASQQHDLDNLLAESEARRDAAREQMIAYLDGKKYARFKTRFGKFVEAEGLGSLPLSRDGGVPPPHRVRHVAPMAIYERLAAVRAYDEWVSIPNPPLERLHALRIACKMLRYTLEFFREVLGPDTKTTIKEIVAVQDHLGDLQDAVVASSIVNDFLKWGTWGPGAEKSLRPSPAADPGAEAYLAAKEAELQHLVDTFPEVWVQVTGTDFSRQMAEAVMVL